MPLCFGSSVVKRVLPFWRHPDDGLIDISGYAEVSIEHLHSADADAVHPFKISSDSLFADIPAHPMPPDSRFCRFRGILEVFLH